MKLTLPSLVSPVTCNCEIAGRAPSY